MELATWLSRLRWIPRFLRLNPSQAARRRRIYRYVRYRHRQLHNLKRLLQRLRSISFIKLEEH